MYKTTRCYVDEYTDVSGRLSARLREKNTSRKVELGGASPEERQAFLRFLSAIGSRKAVLPGLFSPNDDEEFIQVEGLVDFDAPDEIRYLFDESLSYSIG